MTKSRGDEKNMPAAVNKAVIPKGQELEGSAGPSRQKIVMEDLGDESERSKLVNKAGMTGSQEPEVTVVVRE